jgi:hypothetical protein
VLAGLATGCIRDREFRCEVATDCAHVRPGATCEPDGHCSFTDEACPSGRRYGELSGDRAGACVALPADGGPDQPDATPACSLAESGPVVVSQDGQIVENLHIVADGTAGIQVLGYDEVTIRNVWIEHAGGAGIELYGVDHLTIEDVLIEQVGETARGCPADDFEADSIHGSEAMNLTIHRARLRRGSDLVELHGAPGASLRQIQGEDPAGRAAGCVELYDSHGASLAGFSCVSDPATSCTANAVRADLSSDVTIRDGLVRGQAPDFADATGILFTEGDDHLIGGGLVEDLDVVGTHGSCFQGEPSRDVVWRGVNCRDPACDGAFVAWVANGDSSDNRIESSVYTGECLVLLAAPTEAFELIDATPADVAPRAPLDLGFCWE